MQQLSNKNHLMLNLMNCKEAFPIGPSTSISITQHKFSFPNQQVKCQNKLCLKKIEQSQNDKNEGIKIMNFLLKRSQNQITKLTQIFINNKKICISDQLFHEKVEQKSAKAESREKKKKRKNLLIATRNPYIPFRGKPCFRDLKNTVKNIVRLFKRWIRVNTNISDKCKVLKKLKEVCKNKRFNNKLILTLCQDNLVRSSFRDFLEHYAPNLIKQSKIVDKDTHLQMIGIYINMIPRQSFEEKQIKAEDE